MVSLTRDREAVGLKIMREGERDRTGSLGMQGCLFCFPGYALTHLEERLEGCGDSEGGLKTTPMATTLKRITILQCPNLQEE